MFRWRQVAADVDMKATAERVYRPDIYREAVRPLGLPVPAIDWRTEGAHSAPHEEVIAGERFRLGPDRFLDGRRFDPHDAPAYVRGFSAA